jgi:PRD1 phage membrane DNA delivery
MQGGSDSSITAAVSIVLGLVGLAIVAVLVSAKSNTTGVFSAGGGALSQALCKALSPVTGSGCGGGTSVSSGVNFGCTMVNGVQYCP